MRGESLVTRDGDARATGDRARTISDTGAYRARPARVFLWAVDPRACPGLATENMSSA